ncbi:multidrug resistance-associated protein 1-like [Pomacea canaliculata]|uniref:multidrug resistance-associated protein 1-like n=1 Tax=Pomacea canaliculata TaxID=400727 RepID=UPI000D729797|nr:multidrug resistance-associated protein 1-like [Pomacea canaliculata]
MDNMTAAFCGGTALWDKDLLLNNTFPEFTECFRFSILTSLPCGWLWLVTPVHVHYVMRHRLRMRVPSSLLNITKTIVCLLLAMLSVAEGVLAARNTQTARAPPALYVSFVVRSVTFTLAAVLTKVSRCALIASPCVLFIFWFLTLVTSIVPVYHSVMTERDELPDFVVLCAMFSLVVLQFFLSCWAEAVGSSTLDTTKGIVKECHGKKKVANPEVLASFPSKITFFWMNSLIYLGFKRALEPSDMWDLPPKYQSRNAIVKFQELFEKSCKIIFHERYIFSYMKTASDLEINQNEDKLQNGNKMDAKSMMMTKLPVHEGSLRTSPSEKKTVPVFICLVKSFYFELFCSNLIRLFGDCLQFAFPALLG